MKQILIKIFKLFLVLTAVVLGLLLVFGISLVLGWPWWVGIFILVGILGVWLGVIERRMRRLLLLSLAAVALQNLLFFVTGRYRLLWYPLWAIYAAHAAHHLGTNRSPKQLAATAACSSASTAW